MKHQIYYPTKITQKLNHKDATVFACPKCDALNIVLIKNWPENHPESQISGYPSVKVSSIYPRLDNVEPYCWEDLRCNHCHTRFIQGSIPGATEKKVIDDGKAFSYFICPVCKGEHKFPSSEVNYGNHEYCEWCDTPFILEK